MPATTHTHSPTLPLAATPDSPTLPLSPSEGYPTLALLLALVWANLHTVESAGWGDRIELAPRLAVAGVLVGLLAAKSKIRTLWGLLLTLSIGLELVALAHAAASPGDSWASRLAWLSDALARWLRLVSSQGATHDPVVFALAVGLIAYVIGLCSSWLIFRLQNGWWPLVINAAIGIVHLSYATVDSIPPYLASLFIGVLLVASLELHLRRSTWQAVGVPIHDASAIWTLLSAAALGGISFLIAAQLPSGQIQTDLADRYQQVTEPWKDFQRQVDTLVGGSRGQARPGSGLAFSTSLVPRGDFDLSPDPVLKIASPVRRYWRTTTYDLYDGRSIRSTTGAERRYDAAQDLPPDPAGDRARLTIELQVTILSPSANVLFAPDSPRRFSLPTTVDERQQRWDLAALRPRAAIQRGQSYSAISLVSVAQPTQLREAPRDYEPWLQPYLELPVGIPARIGELANRLTTGTTNPFDRAAALEAHLRTLTYSTHVDVPPDDRDWVDHLLFDTQTGYCDYFATALVVMLRTQGIPARVASGFASGLYDEQEQAYIVHENDAHSWPEAYFPAYGWIAFEPSAIRPPAERAPITRPDRPDPSPRQNPQGRLDEFEDELSPGLGTGRGTPVAAPPPATPVALTLASLAAALLLVGLLLALLARAWDRHLVAEPPARRRYAHLRRLLAWGHWPTPAAETPFELSTRFAAAFPDLAAPADQIIRAHVEATYGSNEGLEADHDTEHAWQSLRGPLISTMLRRRFTRRAR